MLEPVLSPEEAKQLIAEADERATALEVAMNEMDILYEASHKLVQAATPHEQLEAISKYARQNGANRGVLTYGDFEAGTRVEEVIAEWTVGDCLPFGINTQLRYPSGTQQPTALINQHKPVFFQNAPEDERLTSEARSVDKHYKIVGCVVLPIVIKERRIATVTFSWDHPRNFDDRDERIYTVLQQQIAALLDSMRLFERLQKRASELEMANSDLNLLYKASEQINSANTYQEVVEAVAQFDLEADVVTLMLWDTWDWKTAEYLDVPVVIDRKGTGLLPAGTRLPKDAFPIAKVMMGQKVWLFEDAKSDPRIDPITAESWAALNIRSFMGPALYIKKRWLGGITFHSSVPRNYSQREKRLLAGVGDLVLAAITRIGLQDEKERARQQAEMLGKVNSLLSQSRDEQAILNAVAELFHDLGIAWFGLAYSLNQSRMDSIFAEYVATIPQTEAAYPAGIFALDEYPCLETAYVLPEKPIFVENVETDNRPEFQYLLTKKETEKWKAVVILPLQTGNDWQGLMSFYWYTPQSFTQEIRAIFTAIMPNVASIVTIRKAYLAEQEARRENELLYKASKGINNAATVIEIVYALEQLNLTNLHIALAVWENYDRESAQYLEFVAVSASSRWQQLECLSVEKFQIASATAHHLLVMVDNTANTHQIDRQSAETIEARGYQAFMMVHLLLVHHCIGILMFSSNTPRTFSAHEKRLAAGIGELVAAAIERLRLHAESEAARKEAERHAQQAQKLASLEERTRLARELHDSVSQVLYGIGLGARTARTVAKQDPSMLQEPLDYILSLAEAGLTEMRALIFELRPESLEQEGLITTLKKQALSLSARYNIHVETHFCDEPELMLDDKESLYRIAREALHNTVKHAQAQAVRLALLRIENQYLLEIQDDGIGFDAQGTFTGHLGLKSMRERTSALNGVLDVVSTPGKGTKITVRLPALN